MRRSSVALWTLVGVVAVALVAGALAGALREPAALDPGSPEGVVQAYVSAVLDRDYPTAAEYLSAETAERCEPRGFEDAYVAEGLTATLEDVSVDGDEAVVRVRMREPAGPPLLGGGGGITSEERFLLVVEDGDWKLTEQPWPLFWCPEEER